MTMAIDFISNWRSLTTGINAFPPAPTFALKNIFKAVEKHASDLIDWEVWTRTSKLASFVSDVEDPVPSSKGTGTIYTVKIPKTSNIKMFTAAELERYKTLANAGYTSNVNDRLQAQANYIKDELQAEYLAVARTREYLAMTLLTKGTVTVGQNTISMNYESGKQTFTLDTTHKWNATGVNPMVAIDEYKRLIGKRANAVPNICILGEKAAKAFVSNADVRAELNANNFRTGVLDLTQGITDGSVIYLGTIRGMGFYEYLGNYDLSGTATDIMDTNSIVMLATDDSFRLHKAPIVKTDGVFQDDIYVRVAEDPYGNWKSWVIEQKSLPIVHNKNLVICSKVITA